MTSDGSGNIVTEYLHGPGIDEPIAMIKGGQTYYYHADGLGSIIAITDSSGRVMQRYEYNSFGEITYQQDPNFKQSYTYTGREYDEESGLYYYRARYYNPKIGRFISEDPSLTPGSRNIPFLLHRQFKNPQGLNPFNYVGNNSPNNTDPTGLMKGLLGGPIEKGGHIYEGGKDALEGAIDLYEGFNAIGLDDYNFYKQTGLHKSPNFEDVDWDKYGDNFEDAWKELMKERLQKKWCPLK